MIIALSGKKQSGKDTAAKIIQFLIFQDILKKEGKQLVTNDDLAMDIWMDFDNDERQRRTFWETKSFAYKIKQICCFLINCTMDQLEDEDFKNGELPPEWDHVMQYSGIVATVADYVEMPEKHEAYTVRKLLQRIGTDACRNYVHPDIWVNSLMSDYTEESGFIYEVKPLKTSYIDITAKEGIQVKVVNEPIPYSKGYPNWIITDLRFDNELRALEQHDALLIRIDRPDMKRTDEHISETQLDNYKFDYRIINNGTLHQLMHSLRAILQEKNIIL